MIHFNRINWWRLILSGVIFAFIAQLIHSIGAILAMGYYTMEIYFPVWSALMMPGGGPPPLSFMLYGLFYSLINGMVFAFVYLIAKDWAHGSVWHKGSYYGLVVFALAGIPMCLGLHLLINIPGMLIIYWGIEALLIYLINGIIVAKLNK